MKLTKVINRSVILIVAVPFMYISCDNTKQQSDTSSTIQTDSLAVDTSMYDTIVEPEQFVKKRILTDKDLYRDYDGGNELADYFIIEIIDRNTFVINRNMAVDFLTVDTASFRKTNGILSLPALNGTITLKDDLSDNENHKEYAYLGQIKPLDMYLISATFWEDWNYTLFDKNKGKKAQSFIGVPYLSADHKHIVCMEVDSFEGVANIGLYAVSSDEQTSEKYIDPVVEMYVKSWIPITTKDNMYWSTDGYLYIPVVYNSNYWEAENNYTGLDQYIRLKPVA